VVAQRKPPSGYAFERHAVYFRPKKWRGDWILQLVVHSLGELEGVARGIEDRYPKGEHAVFVIMPGCWAPEHFADGSEPGKLYRQTTSEYAVFLRRQLQARIAT
jgi:hypothetical protein